MPARRHKPMTRTRSSVAESTQRQGFAGLRPSVARVVSEEAVGLIAQLAPELEKILP
ncbi:hypothetical protein FIU95_01395 [Microbulbifer sp. THAF38]|nr:hypothetical protein FIU95_01395 [Microbulbifer sp. THAF38]